MNPSTNLLEAILELRWGDYSPNSTYKYSLSEIELLSQKFALKIAEHNFKDIASLNGEFPHIPHLLKYRYRESKDSLSCYQLGIGIFSINLSNKNRDEEGLIHKDVFIEHTKKGITELLNCLSEDEGQFDALLESMSMTLRLRYALDDDVSENEILKIRRLFGISIDLKSDLLEHIDSINDCSFKLNVSYPDQTMKNSTIQVRHGLINNRSIVLLDLNTRVALSKAVQNKSIAEISSWVSLAYEINEITANKFIKDC